MNVIFSPIAWAQYIEWQKIDKSMVKKINDLIQDIQRNGFFTGIGKPEPLKGHKAISCRITKEHRLVYVGDEKQNLLIIACKGHYDD